MAYCPRCGSTIENATFCRNCGAQLAVAAPTVQMNPPLATAPARKSPIVKILVTVGIIVFVIIVGGGVAAFFGIRHLIKSSDAYQLALKTLHRSRAVAEAFGDIKDTGFPSAQMSESGGSGQASVSMSVTGSKASGTYYATLQKTNGVWAVVSARLQLDDGRSINVDTLNADPPPGAMKHEGRQLSNVSVDQSAWHEETWPQQLMRFRVPSDWIKKKADQRELDFRKGEMYASTYMAGNGWIYDRDLPAANLLEVETQSAAEQLHNGVIIGYEVRQVGGARGLLTLSDRGDKRIATWKGLVQAGGKQREIDISLGAEERDFAGLEGTFNSILNSIRFEN